jgi:hypothetical protein
MTPILIGAGVLGLVVVAAVAWMLVQNGRSGASIQATPTPPTVTLPPPAAGPITFGTAYDETTLLIPKPITTFQRTYGQIAWSAELSEPAGATKLTFIVVRRSSGGGESVVVDSETTVGNPANDLIANEYDLAYDLGNVPGTYVMRYLRGATILAEGTFTLK